MRRFIVAAECALPVLNPTNPESTLMFNKTLIAVGLAALLAACKPAAEPTPVAAPVEPAAAPVDTDDGA